MTVWFNVRKRSSVQIDKESKRSRNRKRGDERCITGEQRIQGWSGALLRLFYSVHGRRKREVDSWSLPQQIPQQIPAKRLPPPPPHPPPPLCCPLARRINHLLSRFSSFSLFSLSSTPLLHFPPPVVVGFPHRDADSAGLGGGRAAARGQLW